MYKFVLDLLLFINIYACMQVTRDLHKLASQNCPGLNLEEELKKRLLPSPPRTPPHADRKRKIALTGPEAQKRLREGEERD